MQIIGTLKCRETKKCRLWFDQRGIKYHFVDISKKPLSPGELGSVAAGIGWDNMIDKSGKVWKKRQLEWKEFDPEEELLQEPELLTTPIVREKKIVIAGYKPDQYNIFLQEK